MADLHLMGCPSNAITIKLPAFLLGTQNISKDDERHRQAWRTNEWQEKGRIPCDVIDDDLVGIQLQIIPSHDASSQRPRQTFSHPCTCIHKPNHFSVPNPSQIIQRPMFIFPAPSLEVQLAHDRWCVCLCVCVCSIGVSQSCVFSVDREVGR